MVHCSKVRYIYAFAALVADFPTLYFTDKKVRNILLLYNFFGVFVNRRKSHGKFCYFAALYALNKRDKFSFS